MGKGRKAWLWGAKSKRPGVRFDRGQRLPGYYVRFNERAGRHVTHKSHHFDHLNHARTFVRQYNARIELRLIGATLPIALHDAADEFDRECATQTDATKSHYSTSIALLIGAIGNMQVSNVSGADMDSFVVARMETGVRQPTVAGYVRAIGVFFNWAIRKNYAVINPTGEMTNRPSDKSQRERPIITEEILGRIVDALDTPDRKLAAWIAMTTGLDRGVIERLTVGRINFETCAIEARRDKTGNWMCVPIHDAIAPLLARRCDGAQPVDRLLFGLARQKRHRDWWHRAVTEAGCPEIVFRDLRAVAASRLMRLGGASLTDAQRLLGHKDSATTARHYHSPDGSVVRALSRLPLPGHEGSQPTRRKGSA